MRRPKWKDEGWYHPRPSFKTKHILWASGALLFVELWAGSGEYAWLAIFMLVTMALTRNQLP